MSRDQISLHLLRHAHAGDPERWQGPDDVRPLSEKGRHQAEAMGLFLESSGFRPDLIVSSPKTRALETARLVATPLEMELVVRRELGDLLDMERLEALLSEIGDPRRPLLVGHDPDFSALASDLSGATLPLRKGALARIDSPRPLASGMGILRWLLPPDLLIPEPETD